LKPHPAASSHLPARGFRPFFTEKEPPALFPGIQNPKGKAFENFRVFRVFSEEDDKSF
jgi:hypothetical protein